MGISEGLIEIEGKKYHKSCTESLDKEWRKSHGLDNIQSSAN